MTSHDRFCDSQPPRLRRGANTSKSLVSPNGVDADSRRPVKGTPRRAGDQQLAVAIRRLQIERIVDVVVRTVVLLRDTSSLLRQRGLRIGDERGWSTGCVDGITEASVRTVEESRDRHLR